MASATFLLLSKKILILSGHILPEDVPQRINFFNVVDNNLFKREVDTVK
jgi:hypothetical protein